MPILRTIIESTREPLTWLCCGTLILSAPGAQSSVRGQNPYGPGPGYQAGPQSPYQMGPPIVPYQPSPYGPSPYGPAPYPLPPYPGNSYPIPNYPYPPGPEEQTPAPEEATGPAPIYLPPAPNRPVPRGALRGPQVEDYSLIYIANPVPPEIQVHDIITVIVDEKSEVVEQSRYNRQKNGIFKAELREFIRLGNGNLENAAGNSPTIDSNLQGTLQSRALLESTEGIRYRIAATVVDVLPNGTIVLEARKTIRNNWNVWEYSLTGRIRVQDVLANNTVLSENIAELSILKKERGQVRDGTRRGMLLTLYDFLSPI